MNLFQYISGRVKLRKVKNILNKIERFVKKYDLTKSDINHILSVLPLEQRMLFYYTFDLPMKMKHSTLFLSNYSSACFHCTEEEVKFLKLCRGYADCEDVKPYFVSMRHESEACNENNENSL